MPSVFISYSRVDTPFVRRLHEALVARGYDVWVDWEDIPPSSTWFAEIRSGIGAADDFVYVISPDSVCSEVCSRELGEAAGLGKHIVPVLHREPGDTAVPGAAAERNWVFLRDEDDFAAGSRTLFAAIETDLEHKAMHTRLGLAAERWAASGRPVSQLLRGTDLNEAEHWLVGAAAKEPAPSELQRRFVLASRQGATRRQRTVVGGVTVALVVAVVLAVVALIQRSTAIHERNVAYARQLDAQAQTQYAHDPELSLLLALKAAQVSPGASTESALRTAIAASPVRTTWRLGGVGAGDALWSPDGTRLLITSPHHSAQIVRPGSGARPIELPPPSAAQESGWDARGDRVVIGGAHPAVYDAATGQAEARLPEAAVEAALSADGARVATVDLRGVGHVYAVTGARLLASFHPREHAGANCLLWAPQDRVIAQCDIQTLTTADTPAELDVWDPGSGRLVHSIPAPSFVSSAAFSADGRRLAYTTHQPPRNRSPQAADRAVGAAGTIVLDVRTGRRVISFPQSSSDAVFSPVGSRLAYATVGDGLGHVYDFDTHVSHLLTGAGSGLAAIAFNASATDVAVAGVDGTARVYDASTGRQIETLPAGSSPMRTVGFGLGSTSLATASDGGAVRVWAGPDPAPAATRRQSGPGASLRFAAREKTIVEAGPGASGLVMRPSDLAVLSRFAAPAGTALAGAVADSDGRLVAAVAGPVIRRSSGSIRPVQALSFDARSGHALARIAPPLLAPASLMAGLSPGGSRLVTAESSGRADSWDARSGRHLITLPGNGVPAAIAIDRAGHRVALLHLPLLPGRGSRLTGDRFGPVTIDLWELASGRRLRRFAGPSLTSQLVGAELFAQPLMEFSPDGRTLAVGGVATDLQLYSTATGTPTGRLDAGGAFLASLAFSPDGRMLAAGDPASAHVWLLPSGHALTPFAHADPSTYGVILRSIGVQVGWSADSRILATSGDEAGEAWVVADHLQALKAFAVRSTLSPDGTTLVGDTGAGLSTYRCELCGALPELEAVARRHLTRGFTPAERATFLKPG